MIQKIAAFTIKNQQALQKRSRKEEPLIKKVNPFSQETEELILKGISLHLFATNEPEDKTDLDHLRVKVERELEGRVSAILLKEFFEDK